MQLTWSGFEMHIEDRTESTRQRGLAAVGYQAAHLLYQIKAMGREVGYVQSMLQGRIARFGVRLTISGNELVGRGD